MYSHRAGDLTSSLLVKTVGEHGHRNELLNMRNTYASNRQGMAMCSLFLGLRRDGGNVETKGEDNDIVLPFTGRPA